MEVGAAAAAAAGVHLAGYNRDNFFQNLHLSQARRFQKQQIVTSQADLFRADVEQAIGASTAVQDRLIVVSALLLGVSAHTFGFHISEQTSEFLNVLFYLTASVSFLYFMLALFASISANVLARTCQKELLNHCVRPPFEDMMKAVDDAATMFSAENFERQGLSKLFRVPGVQRFTDNLNGAGNRETSPGRDAVPSMDSTDIETSDSLEKLIAQQVSNELLLLEMKEEWDELATYTPYFLVWGLRNLLTSFGFFLLSHFYLDWKPYAFLGHLFYVILTLGLSVLCDRLMATSRTIFTVETFLYLAGQALSWYIVYRERDAQNNNHMSILVVYVSQLANATFAYLRFVWNATDALRSIMSRADSGIGGTLPGSPTPTIKREISSLSIDPSVPNHDRLQIRWQQLSRIRRAARQLCQFGIGAVIAVWMSVVIYQAVPGWTKGAAPPQVRSLSAVDGAFAEDASVLPDTQLVSLAVEWNGRQERLRHLGGRQLGEVLRSSGVDLSWWEQIQGKPLAVFDPMGREISSDLPLAQVGAEELRVVAEAPLRL